MEIVREILTTEVRQEKRKQILRMQRGKKTSPTTKLSLFENNFSVLRGNPQRMYRKSVSIYESSNIEKSNTIQYISTSS